MNAPFAPLARAPRPLRILGIMSGTSLDGADAVLARLAPRAGAGERLAWEVLARASRPYPPALRERLHAALRPGGADAFEIARLHAEVGEHYAGLAAPFAERGEADAVALSGQTVAHLPDPAPGRGPGSRSTLQLGEPARTVERCRLPVVSDLRQADLAAGGGGAPLVAWADLALLSEPGVARAAHNLGGISNLTWLPPDGDPERVIAFDTGPGMCLVDEAMRERYGRDLDEDGRAAAAGRVDEGALDALMAHPYLAAPPPKTTGREAFHLGAMRELADLDALPDADLVATLAAFTAASAARAYRDHVLPRGLDEVVVLGGGARHPAVMRGLAERLPVPVRGGEALGLRPSDREALAFAALAWRTLHGLPATLPGATGARRATVCGRVSVP